MNFYRHQEKEKWTMDGFLTPSGETKIDQGRVPTATKRKKEYTRDEFLMPPREKRIDKG
jgi:hypothetical protein